MSTPQTSPYGGHHTAKPLSSPDRASWVYVNGAWRDDNPPLMSASTHAAWLGSVVFDGARAFKGVAPDLDLHCQRTVRSAAALGLRATLSAGEIENLCWEGIRKFPPGAELYIRPMFFAETGFVAPDPESTRFALVITDSPLPAPTGFSTCLSSYRRPLPNTAPTDAKAACLYPNAGRALGEARAKGFDNAVMLDPIGNVAEFATSNLFIAGNDAVHTPAPNGTFLNGITRQRVIGLLRKAGVETVERAVTFQEVRDADEVFATGNYAKLQPVTRIEDRNLQPGPFYKRARDLYFQFALSGAKRA